MKSLKPLAKTVFSCAVDMPNILIIGKPLQPVKEEWNWKIGRKNGGSTKSV
jgi:hypothetical protein